jgi:hypothetical protein
MWAVRYILRYIFILLHKRHNENVLFGSIIQLHHPLAWYLHPTPAVDQPPIWSIMSDGH